MFNESRRSSKNGGDAGEEAPFARGGYDIAVLAVGGCLRALDEIMMKNCRNAYALVRPPGHHAERNKGRGFCMFNSIALTAFYAMDKYQLNRIAILDWDVHHGNGTQQAFYSDPRVLFISVHQDNNYPPNSGPLAENGSEQGEGFNINIPLLPGAASDTYSHAFQRVIIPAVSSFEPEFILVSCGFDAAAFDPLGRMMLHSGDFRSFTKHAMDLADKYCQGRLLLVHEGGYSKAMVPTCGLAVMEELSQIKTSVKDEFVEYVCALGGREHQAHQDEVIRNAEKLVDKLKQKIHNK